MSEIKQVIIFRNDLKVRRGKSEAQVAHASLAAILSYFDKNPHSYKFRDEKEAGRNFAIMTGDGDSNELVEKAITHMKEHADIIKYKYEKIFDINDPILKWLQGSFTKIVLGCDSLEELLDLERQAKEARLINALITDNGITEFKEDCHKCNGKGFIMYSEKGSNPCSCNAGKINKPTITCLAIGLDYSEKIDKITGHLKLR